MPAISDDAYLVAWLGRAVVVAGLALTMLVRWPDSLFIAALVFVAVAELGVMAERVERRFAELRGQR